MSARQPADLECGPGVCILNVTSLPPVPAACGTGGSGLPDLGVGLHGLRRLRREGQLQGLLVKDGGRRGG